MNKLNILRVSLALVITTLILFLTMTVSGDSPLSGYIIDGDTVYWNVGGDFYIDATPHTIEGFYGCQNLTFRNDGNERTIDVAFRFQEEDNLKPVSARLYNPHTEYNTLSKTCNSDSYGLIDSDTAWCNETVWHYEESNDTWWSEGEYWEHDFDTFNGPTKTIYWDVPYTVSWNDVSHLFNHVSHSSGEVYYVPEVTFTNGQERTIEVCMKRDAGLNLPQSKFDIFMKLSSDTLQQALDSGRYVMLDPWQYANKTLAYNITCTNCPAGMPFLVNGTGFNLGNGTEYVWTTNQTELYYNTFADYLVYTTFEVENGSVQGQNPTQVWDSNYDYVGHMEGSATTSGSESVTVTNNGVTFVDGKYGRSGDFELGESDYLLLENAFISNTATSEAWIWIESTDLAGAKNFIVTGGANDFAMYLDASEKIYGVSYSGGGGAGVKTTAGVQLAIQTWYHVALRHEATNLTLFINGVPNVSIAQVNNLDWETTNQVAVGADRAGNANTFFDGKIDEVRVSNTARSDDWIYYTYIESSKGLTALSTPNTNPNLPSNLQPANSSTATRTNLRLNATVTDPDGDNMNVTFYQLNGSVIGTDLNVSNGSVATVLWMGLDYNTTYSWWVNASDGNGASNHTGNFSFTTLIQPTYVLTIAPHERYDSNNFTVSVNWTTNYPILSATATITSPGDTQAYTLDNTTGLWEVSISPTLGGSYTVDSLSITLDQQAISYTNGTVVFNRYITSASSDTTGPSGGGGGSDDTSSDDTGGDPILPISAHATAPIFKWFYDLDIKFPEFMKFGITGYFVDKIFVIEDGIANGLRLWPVFALIFIIMNVGVFHYNWLKFKARSNYHYRRALGKI